MGYFLVRLWTNTTSFFLLTEDAYKIRIRIDDEPANLDILDTAGQVLTPRLLWAKAFSLSGGEVEAYAEKITSLSFNFSCILTQESR